MSDSEESPFTEAERNEIRRIARKEAKAVANKLFRKFKSELNSNLWGENE